MNTLLTLMELLIAANDRFPVKSDLRPLSTSRSVFVEKNIKYDIAKIKMCKESIWSNNLIKKHKMACGIMAVDSELHSFIMLALDKRSVVSFALQQF
jgi:hypothetical protein